MASIKNYISQMWERVPIIVVNVGVFLLVILSALLTWACGWRVNPVHWALELPPTLHSLAVRPWTLITYMFTHYDFMHILFNMLWLYWFGGLLLTLCTRKQLFALYIYGGLAGGICYILGATLFSAIGGAGLVGASAAVIAIVIAVAILTPDMRIPLLFLGEVKMKWIAIATLVLFAIGLSGSNAGGHVAHFGGALMGLIFAVLYRQGHDITIPFNRMIDGAVNVVHSLFGPHRSSFKGRRTRRSTPRSAKKSPSKGDINADIDPILDKIKRSGYAALTADEKRRLFEASSRLKNDRP